MISVIVIKDNHCNVIFIIMIMAHWCLKKVDYDNLDVFTKPIERIPRPHPRSRSSSVSSGGSSMSSPRSTKSHTSKGHRAIKFVLPGGSSGTGIQLPTQADIEAKADERLKAAMVCVERQRDIPEILAEWPCTALRLSRILSPEVCERVFPSMDQLWSHFLHGFLILKPSFHLRCLDLTDFVPSKAMIYTVLQLIPLLAYKDQLNKTEIFDRIVIMHGLKESSIKENLSQFLDKLLCHPVFKRGKKLNLPGPLEIIIDYLPLSADALSLYCWMMSSALYHLTNVFIKIRSVVFRYAEAGSEFTPMDPLLPLQVFVNSSAVQDIQGVSIDKVPSKHMHQVITNILPKVATRGYKLQSLAISETQVDYTLPHISRGITSVISKCSGLTRLDLTKSRVSGYLGHMLESTSLPLEFLNLSHCCLDESDMSAIFESKHSKNIRDLNLSYVYSSKCSDCIHEQGIHSDMKDVNDNAYPWVIPEESEDEENLASPRGGPSLEFWKSQTSISSPRIDLRTKHSEDILLLQMIFKNLSNLTNLTIFDLISDRFGEFRVDYDTLQILQISLQSLKSLHQLNIEQIPLWDEDIFSLVRTVSSMHSMQSLSLTRSSEAPTMQTSDRFLFWKNIAEAKDGKILRMSIGNFVEESYFNDSQDDFEDGSLS